MAQGVAWSARRARHAVHGRRPGPRAADQARRDRAARRAGSSRCPFERWWQVLVEHRLPGHRRALHPSGQRPGRDRRQRDDRPRDPRGPPGRRRGPRALRRRRALLRHRLGAARAAARRRRSSPARSRPPRRSPPRSPPAGRGAVDYTPSFVDGIGARPAAGDVAARAAAPRRARSSVSLDEIAAAIRLLAERTRVVAEGAGAAAVAAALSGRAGGGKIVCVVSGGNIDPAKLATILNGEAP